ncbi:hypothetical protein FDECE_13036 [Fusarium decemcellulare]|nr:hypothetical protein FDECE_13036 [Fusarium decemcellulare]
MKSLFMARKPVSLVIIVIIALSLLTVLPHPASAIQAHLMDTESGTTSSHISSPAGVGNSMASKLRTLLEADPGLPSKSAPPSYWMLPEHPVASTQSDSLLDKTDVAVLGAGLTGTSAVKSLLETTENSTTITVLEARTICSGATGRNGGNLLTPGPLLYNDLRSVYGTELAHKFIDFTYRVVNTTKEAMEKAAHDESEIRAVTRIYGYKNGELFQAAKQSVLDYEESRPESNGSHKILDKDQVTKVSSFITKVWAAMIETHGSRLRVETNTPVTNITYDPNAKYPSHPYVLGTPRGAIRASKVIHCTNGYSTHLLSGLRGRLYPYKETVTVQDLGDDRGQSRSWAIIQEPTTDAMSGAMTSQLLYLQQNLKSGQYFFGGGFNTVPEILDTNDSSTDSRSTQYLQSELSRFLDEPQGDDQLVSTWTGVQGMTSDSAPLVGRVPKELSGRDGNNEWIAAGFNGGGMCMCWLAADALVAMMRGDSAPEWLPDFFLITKDRLSARLTVNRSIEAMAPLWKGGS